ncbi:MULTISPECIES: sensor histidine kinase [Deferrisoma]
MMAREGQHPRRLGLFEMLVLLLASVTIGGAGFTAVALYRTTQDLLLRSLEVRARAAAGFGALLAADALAEGNPGRMTRYVEGMARNSPETWVAALVFDAAGVLVARGGDVDTGVLSLARRALARPGTPVWSPGRRPDGMVACAVPAETGREIGGHYVLLGRLGPEAPHLSAVRRYGVGVAAVMGCGLLASLLLVRWLAGPIERLEAVVGRVREGDLSVRAEEGAWGEAGRLARGVNAMLDRIERLVAEVRDAEARARRAEELQSLAHLGGGLAHEIKNPLTTVRLLIESMVREARDGGERIEVARQDLELLASQVAKIDEVLEEFVAYARPRPLRPGSVDLGDVFGAVVEAQAVAARERGVRLQAFPGPPARVWADRQRLEQALTNLVANALAHSPPGGTVRVGWSGGDGRFTLWVEDEGEGIPEEIRGRIFEPFFSKREGGMGLGLSIVRSAVLQHGWEIEVEDTAAGGARFVIRGETGVDDGEGAGPESASQPPGLPAS